MMVNRIHSYVLIKEMDDDIQKITMTSSKFFRSGNDSLAIINSSAPSRQLSTEPAASSILRSFRLTSGKHLLQGRFAI
ncbi:hypothetical protein RB195_000451 [Necator americanus]|uniref:Uncharacterized protein n=1 Tax=Necator americanus TaxID=51031 RepID=A0ABR1D9S9_NECAM